MDTLQAGPKTCAVPNDQARMNEPGPCGRSKSIRVMTEVDIFYTPVTRRSHMRRKCSDGSKESTGHEPVRPTVVPDREKWHKLCIAIRDAGNLAIELGSQRFSTNYLIPVTREKALHPCIKHRLPTTGDTPICGQSCQLRSPVLWYDGADMVFHYPFEPWKVIDAEESGDKAAIRAANKPILYGQAHAEAEFANSNSYWHFDSQRVQMSLD